MTTYAYMESYGHSIPQTVSLDISEEYLTAVAMAINGPHDAVPLASKFTLQELRVLRWGKLPNQEQATLRRQAYAAIMQARSLVFDHTPGFFVPAGLIPAHWAMLFPGASKDLNEAMET